MRVRRSAHHTPRPACVLNPPHLIPPHLPRPPLPRRRLCHLRRQAARVCRGPVLLRVRHHARLCRVRAQRGPAPARSTHDHVLFVWRRDEPGASQRQRGGRAHGCLSRRAVGRARAVASAPTPAHAVGNVRVPGLQQPAAPPSLRSLVARQPTQPRTLKPDPCPRLPSPGASPMAAAGGAGAAAPPPPAPPSPPLHAGEEDAAAAVVQQRSGHGLGDDHRIAGAQVDFARDLLAPEPGPVSLSPLIVDTVDGPRKVGAIQKAEKGPRDAATKKLQGDVAHEFNQMRTKIVSDVHALKKAHAKEILAWEAACTRARETHMVWMRAHSREGGTGGGGGFK